MQFTAEAADGQKAAAAALIGGSISESVKHGDHGTGDLVVIGGSSQDRGSALNMLSHAQGVRFAEANWTVTTQAAADDTYYANDGLITFRGLNAAANASAVTDLNGVDGGAVQQCLYGDVLHAPPPVSASVFASMGMKSAGLNQLILRPFWPGKALIGLAQSA